MTLPSRWERFLADVTINYSRSKEMLIRTLAEHDAERAGPKDSKAAEYYGPDSFGGTDEGSHYDLSAHRPTLPAEQPAPTCYHGQKVSSVCRACEADGVAQAAPDGGRLSDELHGWADLTYSPRTSDIRRVAYRVAAIEAKLAAAVSAAEHQRVVDNLHNVHTKTLHRTNAERDELMAKLAAAERDRDEAKKDAIETIKNAIDITAKAVEEERARCLRWTDFAYNESAMTGGQLHETIRDGKPSP